MRKLIYVYVYHTYVHFTKRYRIYVDIMTREKMSSILIPNMDIIYPDQFVHLVGGERWGKGDLYFSQLQFSLH